MDNLPLQPRRRIDCQPVLVVFATLLAASAAAQEREPGGTVAYALSSTTLPYVQGQGLERQSQSRVELVRWAAVGGGGAWGMALGASRDGSNAPRPEIGVRWRSPLENNQRLDLSAWRRFNTDAGPADAAGPGSPPALMSTRIELQFVAPRRNASALGESGAVGVQLSSDSKLSMRIRRGGPMVYYRMQF